MTANQKETVSKKHFPVLSCCNVFFMFHVIQASWHYVMNATNSIPTEDKRKLFFKTNDMVYRNSEEFDSVCCNLHNSEIVKKYLHFIIYIEKMYQRRQE